MEFSDDLPGSPTGIKQMEFFDDLPGSPTGIKHEATANRIFCCLVECPQILLKTLTQTTIQQLE
ncbi:hypothetical protein KY284_035797 [Solanum tuberosum]|nr:hypothetical protein KY284_035797 [Solanum tuberosum]